MTIARLKGKALQLGKTDVLIEDIGPGGLRFLSFIKLSVHPEVILELETEIIGIRVKLYGEIVWLRELQEDLFQYGVEFSIDEDDRASLCQLLNQFAIKLKRNSLVPGCSFIHTDKVHYLRSTNLQKPE